jgi:hypothetical protein
MALQENFSYGYNPPGSLLINATTDYAAQTFTAASGYALSNIELELYRGAGDDPGTLTVELQDVDGGGDPGGTVYSSGTAALGSIPTSGNDAVDTPTVVSMSSYTVVNATQYAIVIKASAASTSDTVSWNVDTADNFAGGARNFSTNSGSTWNGPFTGDACFAVYSTGYVDATATVTGAGSMTATSQTAVHATATITGTGSMTAEPGSTPVPYRPLFKRRLIALGNDRLFYEDL